ncbi:MAG: hypothetical protein OEY93_11715, partial [Anaerolineae bacterium]|nr:hypothetical protein [Anaerolineae bacterium]
MNTLPSLLPQISRREFLQLSAFGMLGLLLPQRATAASGGFTPFGRVMEKSVYLYDSPSYQSTALRSFNMD